MKHLLITILAIFVWGIPPAYAQFVHFQMSIEPELSAHLVQNLDFGAFVTNSGLQTIKKGSSQMGIFEIRGLNTQNIAITLNPPERLVHSNPEISQTIPVSLEASYTNYSNRNASQSQPFLNNYAWLTIGDQSSGGDVWQSAFIFVYGSVDIGEVPDGEYNGTLILTVEYQ